jgi:hypothetical protein
MIDFQGKINKLQRANELTDFYNKKDEGHLHGINSFLQKIKRKAMGKFRGCVWKEVAGV